MVYGAFLALVFLYFMVFFTQIHPLIVLDGDDWNYISYARNAVPMGNPWNPTRILPEILMPTCGFIAAHIVTPVIGDYVFSITVVCAFAVSLFIALYLHFFAKAIEKIFSLSGAQTIAITALFLLAHFWAFCRLRTENNIYMFLAADMTCYFYYTIPTLLNAICVFLFEKDRFFWKKAGKMGKGLLLLMLYLTICSNMFSSIVLIAYAGAVLLLDCILPSLREKSIKILKKKLWENNVFLGIIAAWILAVMLEFVGGRAQTSGIDWTTERLKSAWRTFQNTLTRMNIIFVAFFVTVVFLSFVLLAVSRMRSLDDKVFCKKALLYALCAGVTLLHQILLCAVGNMTWYMSRADVLFALFFYVFLLLIACGTYIVKKIPMFEILLPLIICIVLFNCNTNGKTFRDSRYSSQFDNKMAYAISTNLYNWIVEAYENGEEEITIYIPEDGSIVDYIGNTVSRTLYEHGQIEYPVTVNTVPDNELCEVSGLLRR